MKSDKLLNAYERIPEKFVFSNYLMKNADLNPFQVKEAIKILSELGLIDIEKRGRYTFIKKKPEVNS